MRHVFDTMGTTVSLTCEASAPLRAVERVFEVADRRFSLYRSDSEITRIARGDLRLEGAGPEFIATYVEAIEWRSRTDGAFSPHRPDGVLDLNGIVKATAMREAGQLLDRADGGVWTLVVGGDILTSAITQPGEAIGITDPADRSSLLCSFVMPGDRRAAATSGSAERGDHIWLGGELGPADFVQVSVLAGDIVTADVLATAIVAAGRDGLDDICDRWPIDVLTVDRAGLMRATPGFSDAIRAVDAVLGQPVG